VAPHVSRRQPGARSHRQLRRHEQDFRRLEADPIACPPRASSSGLNDEIRFHIDQQAEKTSPRWLDPDEARRQAVLKFGGVERVKDGARDEVRPALLEDSVRDMRHAVRVLRRRPGSRRRRW
jgi:hypothetical protein